MKLNKFLMFGAIGAGAFGISSCTTEWLETSPNQSENIEQYYTTDAAIQEAVVAAYDPLHWYDFFGTYTPLNYHSDIMTDQCYPGGGDPNDLGEWKQMFNFTIPSTMVMTSNYSTSYSGVKRCNDVIFYIENYAKDALTEKNRAFYEAQVRVLRNFYYRELWKWWGNIVYYTTNLSGDTNFLGTQYTADEVYEFMITDLEEVLAMNALNWKSDVSVVGQVTTPMAYMLYAELVMYQNDTRRYPQVLNYMKEIINSSEYNLHPDYAELWDAEHEWCEESIWEINYSDVQGNRDWGWSNGPGGCVMAMVGGARGYDGRDGIHTGSGWGFCTVRHSAYEAYEEGDTRRDASIWTPEEGSYQIGDQDTGHFVGKYSPINGNNAGALADQSLNWNNNFRVYRYSEALLNAAEMVLAGAGSGDAQGWLDAVRARAGVGSVAATKDNIIHERALEFLAEGKRYWDIIRSGLAPTVLVPDNEVEHGRTGTWSENKKYLPFPQSEIDQAQGTITQNPY
ncbi:MAG: RagB/SusD family nutrient uptake outer membrane protein [Muribaculaceae bacterium]|nr:RagB/SusD family nutrient uptake outer membrane protein [Muribaculaceae bacterium]